MAKKNARPPRTKRPANRPKPVAAPPAATAVVGIRQTIIDEVARQNAIAKSREPLAMIAEASVRVADEALGPGYVVVDATGAARMRMVDGIPIPFTIADLVGELRAAHPNLFQEATLEAEGLSIDAEGDHSAPLVDAAPPRPAAPVQTELPLSASPMPPPPVLPPTAPPDVYPERASIEPPPSVAPPPEAAIAPIESPTQPVATRPMDAPAIIAPGPAPAASPDPIEAQPMSVVASARAALRSAARTPSVAPDQARRRAPRLPPAWMPSQTARMRVLYAVAFVGGMLVFAAVRHFA